jgi:TPR repeat protein
MSKDVKWYQKRAQGGDLDAQYQLASMYETGEGIAANP